MSDLLENEIGFFASLEDNKYEEMIAAYCQAARECGDNRPIEILVPFAREAVDDLAVDIVQRVTGGFDRAILAIQCENEGRIVDAALTSYFTPKTLHPDEFARVFTEYFHAASFRRRIVTRIAEVTPQVN